LRPNASVPSPAALVARAPRSDGRRDGPATTGPARRLTVPPRRTAHNRFPAAAPSHRGNRIPRLGFPTAFTGSTGGGCTAAGPAPVRASGAALDRACRSLCPDRPDRGLVAAGWRRRAVPPRPELRRIGRGRPRVPPRLQDRL